MPKTRSERIKETLTRNAAYSEIPKTELDFYYEAEEKLQSLEDKPEEKKAYFAEIGDHYREVGNLINEAHAASISELSEDQVFENTKKAVSIAASVSRQYQKINGFSRFFSHFVPNSWTKAGRLRNEMEDCNKAFREAGHTDRSMSEYYKRSWSILDDPTDIENNRLYLENGLAKAAKQAITGRGKAEAKHKFIEENLIADPIDLSETVKVNISEPVEEEPEQPTGSVTDLDESFTEPITVNEAGPASEDLDSSFYTSSADLASDPTKNP